MTIMINVDSAEISKFSTLASRWWDTSGECKSLHEINPLRMSFIEQHLNLTGKKTLDIGCGGGILTESLARQGALVTGLDMAQDLLDVATLHLLESKLNVNYICVNAETFAQKNRASFEVITCMEMLEHVPNPEGIILAASELLVPNGHLFVSTLNRSLKSFLQAILGAEYLLKLLPKGTHHYDRFIKPSELIASARKVNLSCVGSTGITYHPLKKQYSLTPDISVNYLLHFIKAAA